MTYATLDDALALAVEKFKGVVDKAGQPYILHCLRVMLTQSDNAARQVGLLHDLVEDTDVTIDDLRLREFDPEVIQAIDLMTHRQPDSYAAYVLRLAKNPIARSVKLADLNDNYRLDRVAYRVHERHSDAKRIQKYILTYQFLTEQIDEAAYVETMRELEA